jgi:hypothetical protein
MAILHVSMLMTDGIYCVIMSAVIVAALVSFIPAVRAMNAEDREKRPTTLTEAIDGFGDFDLRAEACIMGLEAEAGCIALALVMRLDEDHFFDSVKKAEAKKALRNMRPHMAVAVRRLLADGQYWGF